MTCLDRVIRSHHVTSTPHCMDWLHPFNVSKELHFRISLEREAHRRSLTFVPIKHGVT
jgi:hypothetical protein